MDLSPHPGFAAPGRAAGRPALDCAGSERLALRLLDPAAIDPAAAARWDELGAHRAGDNVFAEPWLMRLSLEHCDAGKRAVLAVVEDRDGAWIGAVPLARSLRHGRALWPNWSAWSHPNQFNGTPLVRQGHEARFWRGLLAGLDREPGLALSLCLGDLPADDPVNAALAKVCRDERRPWQAFRHYARASLQADAGLAARAAACFKPKHRRRLGSLERQLAEDHGAVEFHVTRDPARIADLAGQFLALEAAGWKGAAGSALGAAGATRDFFLAAARAAAERGQFEVSWLEAGGQCLAITTQFVGAGGCCGFKRAHDERFAKYAPGQLHLRYLTEHLCGTLGSSFDSCAPPAQDSVNRLWPDRRELFDCRVAIGSPAHRLAFRALAALQGAYHAAKRMW